MILHDAFSSWRSICFLPLKTEVHAKRRDVESWEGSWNLNKGECRTVSTDPTSNRWLSNLDFALGFKAKQNDRENAGFSLSSMAIRSPRWLSTEKTLWGFSPQWKKMESHLENARSPFIKVSSCPVCVQS